MGLDIWWSDDKFCPTLTYLFWGVLLHREQIYNEYSSFIMLAFKRQHSGRFRTTKRTSRPIWVRQSYAGWVPCVLISACAFEVRRVDYDSMTHTTYDLSLPDIKSKCQCSELLCIPRAPSWKLKGIGEQKKFTKGLGKCFGGFSACVALHFSTFGMRHQVHNLLQYIDRCWNTILFSFPTKMIYQMALISKFVLSWRVRIIRLDLLSLSWHSGHWPNPDS